MENGKKMDMQAQTAPDAPKKNAAPAEAPKSLGATISNVFLFKLPLRGLIQVLKSSCESLFSSFSEHLFQNSNPSSS